MNKTNLENVFSQLSNVDNVDEMLKDEGLFVDQIISDGIEKLKAIQATHVSKKRVIDLLKIKMTESISKKTLKAVETLEKLIPSMNGLQINLVFRSLSEPLEKDQNIDQLVKELKSDSDLLKIMKNYNFGEEK